MDAQRMLAAVRQAAQGWQCDVVSLGYPGRVHKERPIDIPRGAQGGDNDNAFVGDQCMWEPRWEFE